MKIKKLVIIAGIAVAVLGIGGGAAWWFMRSTPEDVLYKALAKDAPKDEYTTEDIIETKGQESHLEGLIKPDGTYKASGTMECSAKSSTLGTVKMSLDIKQVQQRAFLKFKKVAFTEGSDSSVESALNSFFSDKVANKWILAEEKDPAALGFKEYGITFSPVGTSSKRKSAQFISDKLKESKAVTIIKAADTTYEGKKVTEFTLSVSRAAYEDFIDSVEPGFKYKSETMDAIFDDSNEEVVVVVDKKDKTVVYQTYSMPNLCRDIVSTVDETAATELPETMKVKNYLQKSNKADSITEPTDYITFEDLTTLLYQ